MIEYYKLDGKKAVPATQEEVLPWFGSKDRIVAKSEKNGVRVSTVFLVLNHAFNEGAPMIFETMIFGGEHDQWQERCSTWDEAEAQHREACKLAGITSTV